MKFIEMFAKLAVLLNSTRQKDKNYPTTKGTSPVIVLRVINFQEARFLTQKFGFIYFWKQSR